MASPKRISLIIGAGILFVLMFVSFGGGYEYQDRDTREIDRKELFATTQSLLEESEAWPVELSDGTVEVKSSLEPYPVRTVRYEITELDATLDEAIAYIRDHTYGGLERRVTAEKYEDTLWQPEGSVGHPTQWVRRSVHISPPPGGNRDAVVLYVENRPDPKTYLIGFQSVETIEGNEFVKEDAVRFKVMPSLYKVETLPSGKLRVRKIETVDPRGALSPLMNNLIISKVFFRNYMFEQAKEMRVTFVGNG
jgi:hypothetical protein